MRDLVESVLRFESYFLLMMLIMFGYLYEYSIQRLFNLIQSIKNHSAMTLIVNRKLLSFNVFIFFLSNNIHFQWHR